MWSHGKGSISAATQVKVSSPEILHIAQGQGFHVLEASNEVRVNGECALDVPGSESVAGKRTACIGTWENRSVPRGSPKEAEEVDCGYGVPVVGPFHTRGVGGVMPAEDIVPLEGNGGLSKRDEVGHAIR